MGCHLQRLGIIRLLIGVVMMYLTIPVFLLIHGAVVVLMLKWMIFPLLGIVHIRTKNYIVIDRYKVQGLSGLDTFNCLFCGWVNGVCTFLNAAVDTISENPRQLGMVSKIFLFILLAIYTLNSLVIQTLLHISYNAFIALPHGLKTVSYLDVIREVRSDKGYARNHKSLAKQFIIYQKITWKALNYALEQIECAWCPIKHFETMESVVYPAHHKLFFEPDQVEELKEFLKEHGTVHGKR